MSFINDEDLAKLLKELDPAYAASKQDGVSVPSHGGPKTILAVDDMPPVLNSVKALLKDMYKVIGVTSAQQAEHYLKTQQADLILLDIEMPQKDGITFARELRMNNHTKWIPVVFLTGTATNQSVTAAFKSGGIDYIVKPVNSEILVDKLKKILG